MSEARFIRGSVADIALPPCVAAVAIGEVFNYLSSKGDIRRAFRNVFRSLDPGGVFLFDIKEPLSGPGKKTRNTARRGNDWAIFVEVEEDPRKQKLTRKIMSFRKEGKRYRRHDEVHRQTIPRAAEVAGLLAAVGFSARVRRGYRNFRLTKDRKVIIAKKPV